MRQPSVPSGDSSFRAARRRRLARLSVLGVSLASAGLLLRDPGGAGHHGAGLPVVAAPSAVPADSRLVRRLGVSLHALDETAHRAGFHGLMVDAVHGAAARAGVQVGDCIVQVNGEPVDTPDELSRLLSDKAATAGLLLRRGERHVFIPIQLSS